MSVELGTPPPAAAPQPPNKKRTNTGEAGVPVWLPLIVAVIAVIFAFIIATRICPTLSALVSPPDPMLPPNAVLESHESNGTEDSWLYTTADSGCAVAAFFEQKIGPCNFEPSAKCKGSPDPARSPEPSTLIARCSGRQNIAQYAIQWTVQISENVGEEHRTSFRVYREVS